MKCLTSVKSGQLFDVSTFLCVKKKALYTWSQSSFNSGRLAPCTLYLLTIATNSLTALRQADGQQAENSTFPLFEENTDSIADYLRKVSAQTYFRIDINSGLGTREDYNPQIQLY